jgi:hypothetical protein
MYYLIEYQVDDKEHCPKPIEYDDFIFSWISLSFLTNVQIALDSSKHFYWLSISEEFFEYLYVENTKVLSFSF